jgi:hypothetical protein
MSRQNKAGTISVLLIGLIVLSVCLVSIDTRVSAIARLQNSTVTPTPCDADPDDCADYATDDAMDAMTASADALTATAGATPGTITTTATTRSGIGTPTLTPTLTATGSAAATTLAPSPSEPTPSIEPERLAPTDTPTPIPDSQLICFPGQPVVLNGEGPARAPYLVYFGQRVVSGGSVSSNGRFAATLIIGPERAGVYTIAVRVRGTSKALLETTCAVPNVTPTLVPRARELP